MQKSAPDPLADSLTTAMPISNITFSSHRQRDTAFWRLHLLALTLMAAGLFWLWQDARLDFWLASLSYSPAERGFPLKDTFWMREIGHVGLRNFVIAIGVATLAVIVWPRTSPELRTRAGYVLLSMAACTLAISVLKQGSVHHCPWDLVQFGGTAIHLPLFASLPAGQSAGQCFPGGHASAGFALLALPFAARGWRPRWVLPLTLFALLMGGLMSGIQMVRGAHFLSHNLWTLWFCWAICLAVYALYRWRRWM